MTDSAPARKLGGARCLGREVSSELELAVAVREGLPSSALTPLLASFRELPDSEAMVYGVVGNVRTLQRKRARASRLSVRESDRLARLARLVGRAEESLGGEEKANRWLVRPSRALGGYWPIALLDTDAGARAVEQVLGRIEHGVYS